MKINYKSLLPHAVAIVVFVIISFMYFAPAASGYKLRQHDNKTFNGMAAEIQDYREKYNGEPFWTSRPFGGMPAGLISQQSPNNYVPYVGQVFQLWLPHPVSILFVAMLSFYILMLCLRANPWAGIAGAAAFGLSTYTILIIGAGHNTKAMAIAYMPAALGGLILAYRSRPVLGSALFMLFMTLELRASHLQVTYYLGMIFLFWVIAEGIRAIKEGQIMSYIKRSALVLVAGFIAVLPNYTLIKATLEVGKESTRSESKLTINPDGTPNKDDKTTGLDRSYITGWSYGIKESWNLLIPNAAGGNSRAFGEEAEELLGSSDVNPQMIQQVAQTNAYWGPQEQGTGGPTYLGAVVILLFVMALVFLPDVTKWGILAATILGLMLAWGKNYMGLTDFFIDNVPGYNKFRAVTILLCILQVTVPLLGFWFVDHLAKNREKYQAKLKWFYYTGGAVAIILVIFYLVPGKFFDFMSPQEKTMFTENINGKDPQMNAMYVDYKKALIEARIGLFKADTARSLFFVIAAFGIVFAFLKYTASRALLYGGLGLLAVVDLWTVDTRYLNNGEDPSGRYEYRSWVPAEEKDKPFFASEADKSILQTELATKPDVQKIINERITAAQQKMDGEPLPVQVAERIAFSELNFATNYRVLNVSDPFNDGETPYFHKSVGGYHGAKPKRIAEVIAFHYSREIQAFVASIKNLKSQAGLDSALAAMQTINMVNTKYIIVNPERPAIPNPYAFGNGWFVSDIHWAKSADEEITELPKQNLRKVAVIDEQYKTDLSKIEKTDSVGGTVTMTSFKPNYMTYETNSNGTYLCVFSEVFATGWRAYVDGTEAPVIRSNYFLRSIVIPKGRHKVEWKYTLAYYEKAETFSLIGSLAVFIVLIVVLVLEFMGKLQRDKVDLKEGA